MSEFNKTETSTNTNNEQNNEINDNFDALDDEINSEQHDDSTNEIELPKMESFDDLVEYAKTNTKKPFNENILRGVYNYGYEKPSKIQQLSITPIISNRDMLAQAPSGTGKTAAFTIGTLQCIDDNVNVLQAIIVTPTRELAEQINRVVIAISEHMTVKTCLCVGGITTTRDNISQIKNEGRQIVIGTPGRLNELIKRKSLPTEYVKLLIMDEVDELLRNDFIPQIQSIVSCVADDTNICLYSATISQESLSVANKFLRNPVNILVNNENLSLDGIQQFYINVEREEYKMPTVIDLYKHLRIAQSIIFVSSKEKSMEVENQFVSNDYQVSVINSDLSPSERSDVMQRFRQGECRVLIATDIISRGIDVQQVNVVINYDIPSNENKESYLHRIGRSGRYGRKGLAINLVTRRTKPTLDNIYRHFNIKDETLPSNIAELI
jgi:translation initiation factor 4A